jgi:rod shape determining protein RodA
MTQASFGRFYWAFFFVILGISLWGVIFLYSASYNMGSEQGMMALNQMVRIAVGLLVFLAVIAVGYKSFLNVSYVLYAVVLICLVMVLIFGTKRYGAQRWLYIGPFSFQPSEFSKLAVILALSHYLGQRKKNLYQIRRFVISFIMTLVPLVLVLKEPDLGTSLIFLPILFFMLYVWGAKLKYFLLTFSLGLCSLPFLWTILKPYQKDRLFAFMDPDRDPLGASYTVIQSKIAIGSGGFLGKGWLHGSQNKLHFIPEHHTDFIFSVVGEEGGFIGVLVFFLLIVLFFRLAFIAMRHTTDVSGRLLATGVISMVFFHIFINVGMTIGMMPVTGLPLPLISYGGSSLLTFFVSFGLLASIFKERSFF